MYSRLINSCIVCNYSRKVIILLVNVGHPVKIFLQPIVCPAKKANSILRPNELRTWCTFA